MIRILKRKMMRTRIRMRLTENQSRIIILKIMIHNDTSGKKIITNIIMIIIKMRLIIIIMMIEI